MVSLWYNIKQALTQMVRNSGMSLASIFSILAMLLILGLCFVMVVNINLFTEVVKQDYDQVEVFLLDGVTREDAEDMMTRINAQPGVLDVTYRSKDEALDVLKTRWGESGYLLDSLGENPLPASLLIEVNSLEDASKVAAYAGSIEGIDDVQYYQETVDKLTKITNFIQIGALAIMAFLVVVSIVVVSNTIKLTVAARSDEIMIMKYVGATNWFIRGPFICEGVLIGLIASIISTGLITLIYERVLDAVGDQIIAIISCPLVPVGFMASNMMIIFVALGCAIGAWGSLLSMRKYLDT